MARLLASAGESALRPAEGKERLRPSPAAPAPPAAPEEPPAVTLPLERTVLEAGPDPEPVDEQPATLEALAARFGARPASGGERGKPAGKSDRSRQEREKQAAILARLRQGR